MRIDCSFPSEWMDCKASGKKKASDLSKFFFTSSRIGCLSFLSFFNFMFYVYVSVVVGGGWLFCQLFD